VIDPKAVAAARKAAGLSVAQAAALVGARPASWYCWELGRHAMHQAAWHLFQWRLRQCVALSFDAVVARALILPTPMPEQIRSVRGHAGLSQREAGQLVHASLSSWSKWEADSLQPNHRQMPRWTWALFRLQLGRDA
jgi:DNA-binding transcriptional regulator YiaG